MKTFIPTLAILVAVRGSRGEAAFQTVECIENAACKVKADERTGDSMKVFFAEIFQ